MLNQNNLNMWQSSDEGNRDVRGGKRGGRLRLGNFYHREEGRVAGHSCVCPGRRQPFYQSAWLVSCGLSGTFCMVDWDENSHEIRLPQLLNSLKWVWLGLFLWYFWSLETNGLWGKSLSFSHNWYVPPMGMVAPEGGWLWQHMTKNTGHPKHMH